MNSILKSHAGEIGRAIRNYKYEKANDGIYLPGSRIFIGGAMKVVDHRDGFEQTCAIDPNTITNEGLNYLLNAGLPPGGGYAQISSWYVAPYAGNYTPDGTLTAAGFPVTATELTTYTSATRLALTIVAATTTMSTGNTGSEALVVLNAGANVYGAAIVSASAKSSVTGVCLAAVRFASPRLAMASGDKLSLGYVLTATST